MATTTTTIDAWPTGKEWRSRCPRCSEVVRSTNPKAARRAAARHCASASADGEGGSVPRHCGARSGTMLTYESLLELARQYADAGRGQSHDYEVIASAALWRDPYIPYYPTMWGYAGDEPWLASADPPVAQEGA